MKVLVADKLEASGVNGLKSLGCEVVLRPELTPETIGAALAEVDPTVLVVRGRKVPGSAIGAGRSLKLIVRAGAGYDTIDVKTATERGVGVCNCPGMNAVAVAELTMGLLVCCDRRIPDQTIDSNAGKWDKSGYGKARGLKGAVLGVVGLGAIGMEVIRRARAFDMSIVAWSRSLTADKARAIGVGFGGNDRAGLLKMAAACDALTIHVAATAETDGLCDAAFFGAMKNGALFVNTARGSVVDDAAMREAIEKKGIRCGVDVYRNQPQQAQAEGWACPFAGLRGVSLTQHCGASTDQAQEAVAAETVRVVEVFKRTGRFENCVNAGALGGEVVVGGAGVLKG